MLRCLFKEQASLRQVPSAVTPATNSPAEDCAGLGSGGGGWTKGEVSPECHLVAQQSSNSPTRSGPANLGHNPTEKAGKCLN